MKGRASLQLSLLLGSMMLSFVAVVLSLASGASAMPSIGDVFFKGADEEELRQEAEIEEIVTGALDRLAAGWGGCNRTVQVQKWIIAEMENDEELEVRLSILSIFMSTCIFMSTFLSSLGCMVHR